MRLLNEGTDVAFVSGQANIDSSGTIRKSIDPYCLRAERTGLSHEQFLQLFAPTRYFSMPSSIVLRKRLLEVGMLDPAQTRRHDIDMWLRAIHAHTWAYDPEPHVIYRVDTPGSISRSVANAAYFYLKAMLKNRAAYDSPAMTQIVKDAARAAMATAITDGTDSAREEAWALARPHLKFTDQLLFGISNWFPWLFKKLNSALRARYFRHQ
jgi:hypothetical protein